MAEEGLELIRLREDFYRDGFYKALMILLILLIAVALLISGSVYLFVSKPAPVTFATDNEWRVLQPVPLNQPYIKTPDLLQWASDALTKVFALDFVNYMEELKGYSPYFTTNGWQKFLDQLNIYANYDAVQRGKLFINDAPAGAPYVLNQGLLQGKYSWWIQMPIRITSTTSGGRGQSVQLVIQILVVRVPTLNNLYGVGIENMIVLKGQDNQGSANA